MVSAYGSGTADRTLGAMLDFGEVIARAVQRSPLRLVAIDGLPLAGKSTLADRLALAVGAKCVRLDDFVKPEADGNHTINHRFRSISSGTANSWPQ